MREFLTTEEATQLRKRHRSEKNRRTADRIKTILLCNKGWTYKTIAEALLLDEETISLHVREYEEETKISYGWIRTGQDKLIATSGSRTRMNLMGSLDLETMDVTIGSYETVDSEAMEDHFEKVQAKYPKAAKIHMILDQGPYNKSQKTREAAKKHGIVLHYLPPYSPNLNPIERLWKVMNEQTRNNRFFASAKDFRETILHFFAHTWPKIAMSMVDRINDNFTPLKSLVSL